MDLGEGYPSRIMNIMGVFWSSGPPRVDEMKGWYSPRSNMLKGAPKRKERGDRVVCVLRVDDGIVDQESSGSARDKQGKLIESVQPCRRGW
jgi:hypothetical protein